MVKERDLFDLVEKNTPEEIRKNPIIDISNKKAFEFVLERNDLKKLGLWKWFDNYRKEAMVSTGGIRGPQNILYPWDTRFPINQVGMALATLGKCLVLRDKISGKIEKLEGREVRYNSKSYVELISRIQAAQGIKTHLPVGGETIPIWLSSFLIFKLDLAGGENVTSSHAVSTKTATKDLNDQGSQFMPEESMEFVSRIEDILKTAEREGEYRIKISSSDDPLISEDLMKGNGDGIGMYTDYLKRGVATKRNIRLIKSMKNRIYIDCVGGCMHRTMTRIFRGLGIEGSFGWFNEKEDPFFHGIGKVFRNPKTGKGEYFDYSCDSTIREVFETMGYEEKMKNRPVGTVVEITDPDGDRLVLGCIEPSGREGKLKELGIDFIRISKDMLMSIYTPNQSFLMTMDFHVKQLKKEGIFGKRDNFIIMTTASATSWAKWAGKNGIKVIFTPVGFKEIAAVMRKVEKQQAERPGKDVIIRDVFGNDVNIGKRPRLVFAGEESGGMITGPEEMIRSKKGRTAIAMREKSAGEAMIIVSALAGYLEGEGMTLSEYLESVFEENGIRERFDLREEKIYYNESEPDPVKLVNEKEKGEAKRDDNDRFFLGIAFALSDGKICMDEAKKIMKEAFPGLDFSNLEKVVFVGDGTFFRFSDKYVEVRKSGTDAKTKAYAVGDDKRECREFARAFIGYPGKLTKTYERKIGKEFIGNVQKRAMGSYIKFLKHGM
ncbi:MAG: hypothetical protein JW754_03335 [Candidatus Aenigmarchaeota archaeon]|nr:hypothetical protein [Candidatus Aenigmarchaeota archaeon]